jgi:hypothetical protein
MNNRACLEEEVNSNRIGKNLAADPDALGRRCFNGLARLDFGAMVG